MSAQLLDCHGRRYLLAVQVGPVPARIEEEADGELVRREIRQSVAFAGSLVIRAITAQQLLDPPIPRSDRRPWVRTILPQCLREDGSSRRRTARERVSGWRISSGLPGLRLTGINDSDSFPPLSPLFPLSMCRSRYTTLFSISAPHAFDMAKSEHPQEPAQPFPESLCHQCRYRGLVQSRRDSVFIKCENPALPKYLKQPVLACPHRSVRETNHT